MPVHIAATAELNIGGVKKSVASVLGSVSYLKAFIPIAAYNIIGNRINYDPSLFKTHMLKETEYKTFSNKIPKKHDLDFVYGWLKSAMESIQKKYLKQLYLIIRNKQTNDVIEFYCFTIQYLHLDKSLIKSNHWETVYESTAKIFQSINLLSELQMLDSSNVSFAMQVNLNELAPKTYLTPSFDKGTPFVDPEETDTYSLGSVSTGRHKLRIHGKGNAFNVEEEEREQENEPNIFAEPLSETSNVTKSKITVLENRCLNKYNKQNDVGQLSMLQERNDTIDEGSPKTDIDLELNVQIEENNFVLQSTKNTKNIRNKANALTEKIDVANSKDGEVGRENFVEVPEEKKKRITRDKTNKLAANMDSENTKNGEVESEHSLWVPKGKKMRVSRNKGNKLAQGKDGEEGSENILEVPKEKNRRVVRDKANKLAHNVDFENTEGGEVGSENLVEALKEIKKKDVRDKTKKLIKNANDKETENINKRKLVRNKASKLAQVMDAENAKDEVGSEIFFETPKGQKRKEIGDIASKWAQNVDAESDEALSENFFEVPKKKKRKTVNNKSADVQKENGVVKDLMEGESEGDTQNTEEDSNKKFDNLMEDLTEGHTEEADYKDFDKTIGDIMEFQAVKCLCGINGAVDGVDLIVCDNCGCCQHCACVGYKRVSDVPRPHICYPCHVLTGKKFSDIRMSIHRNQKERQMLAVARLVAFYCVNVQNSPSTIFDQIEDNQVFIDNMLKFNFIYEENGEYSSIHENIKRVLEGVSFYKVARTVSVLSSPISIK